MSSSGPGSAGSGSASGCKQAGLTDFVILEKSDRVGGVWRDNSYPGAACDVPSHLYSFSFAPKADWPDKYASQADILDYLSTARAGTASSRISGSAPKSRDARWDEAAALDRAHARRRVFEAQSLVSATGQLSRPFRPHLPGIESFSGPAFHSAEWRHDFDLTASASP